MANEKRLIDANEIEELFYKQVEYGETDLMDAFEDALQDAQTVDAVEVDKVAKMLFYLLGDCPFDYYSYDEWIPEVCELQGECPNTKDKFGCWKQFIKHYGERRDGE